MKRSRAVRLTLVASSATIGVLPACSPRQEAMHCVERGTNRVVPDSLCGAARVATDASGRPLASTTYGGGYGGGYSPFLWYYGGGLQRGYMRSGGYVPMRGSYYRSSSGISIGGARGTSVTGGSTRGSVSRGGFGGTASGHAGS